MTLICPVLNLISMFQNVLQKPSILKHVRGHLNFHEIAIKHFDIVFMFVMSLSILLINP